jgi:peptidyl-tRNA hydrolase, PTH1 family
MADRYLIVGLGNPGREYEKNRHNIGFRSVDALASAYNMKFDKKQSKAFVADGTMGEAKVLLAKPQTYMNLSGESVSALLAFYKIPISNLLVISDDMDIPAGTLRIREKGGSGGQNGLKSIIVQLGTQDFARLRVGLSRPPGRMDPAAYLLQDFSKAEEADLGETLDRVVKAVETWLKDGIAIMMTRWNGTAEDAARAAQPPQTNPKPNPKPDTKNTPETATEPNLHE